ncbi:hypothetical protein BK662_14205 [Pseudomonas frederiksbergensis]|uniref:Uncharacterized protein n=1 Tax=Pseudomonas frederiksbergensis TaxID=104087 RepID=A0A423HPY3_9PSED|nr:hypothetical protein BK662_14205 [Pseudomonas frederiksbergensis]
MTAAFLFVRRHDVAGGKKQGIRIALGRKLKKPHAEDGKAAIIAMLFTSARLFSHVYLCGERACSRWAA